MGEQHPLDMLHADFLEVIQDAPIAEVDQQSGISIPKHVDIARVGPHVEFREALRIRLPESIRRGSSKLHGEA